MDSEPGEITRLLAELRGRNQEAAARLFDLLYNELRHTAQRHLRNERQDHTLQATALVHEAYLRVVGRGDTPRWNSRGHFFAAAADPPPQEAANNANGSKSQRITGANLANPECGAQCAQARRRPPAFPFTPARDKSTRLLCRHTPCCLPSV